MPGMLAWNSNKLRKMETAPLNNNFAPRVERDAARMPETAFGVRMLSANPFAGSARFGYQTVKPGNVSVAVYDLQGKRIKSLFAGDVASGAHAREWDGRTVQGKKAPAGIYIVRLEADGFSRSLRAVLTR